MALLELSSSVTIPKGPIPDQIIDHKTMPLRFTVLITGGIGTGYYVPLLSLSGMTNESTIGLRVGGASAIVNWPTYLQAGDPYASSGQGGFKPSIVCDGIINSDCPRVEFTYGVPQDIHLVAETKAVIDPTGLSPAALEGLRGIVAKSSFTFKGINLVGLGNVHSTNESPAIITIQLTIYTEPPTLIATPRT